MNVDVAIVGAGPAGLCAATEIAARGGRVAVFDENAAPGGKLLGQLHEEPGGSWWKGWEVASDLVESALTAGAELYNEAMVWGIEPKWRLRVANTLNRHRSPTVVEAHLVLVATGAYEKPIALPGWTLPGVMTVGAAQVLTNIYRVRPGKRVLIAGIDPLSLTVARQLRLADVDVVGVVLPPAGRLNGSAGSPMPVLKSLGNLSRLAPSPLLRLGATLLRWDLGARIASRVRIPDGVRVWGIPMGYRTALQEVVGHERVEAVVVAAVDSSGRPLSGHYREIPVDAVCLSGGLAPHAELLSALGTRFTELADLGGTVPLHDSTFETDLEGLFVAGNAAGVEGANVAMAQGRVAGIAMSRRLGLGGVTDGEINAQLHRLDQARHEAKIEFYSGAAQARADLANRWYDANGA